MLFGSPVFLIGVLGILEVDFDVQYRRQGIDAHFPNTATTKEGALHDLVRLPTVLKRCAPLNYNPSMPTKRRFVHADDRLKIGLLILDRGFLHSWFESQVYDSLGRRSSMKILTTKDIAETIHASYQITADSVEFIDAKEVQFSYILSQLYFMSLIKKYKRKSTSFRFRIILERRGNFTLRPNERDFYKRLSIYLKKRLRHPRFTLARIFIHSFSMNSFLRYLVIRLTEYQLQQKGQKIDFNFTEYDLILIPSTNNDIRSLILLKSLNKSDVKSLLVIDNWDNLSSKSVFHIKPTFISVMGFQQALHAHEIQGFKETAISILGLPRYQSLYRHKKNSSGLAIRSKIQELTIAYLGFGPPHNEVQVLEFILDWNKTCYSDDTRLTLIYRPHPTRTVRYGEMNFTNLKQKYPNLIDGSNDQLTDVLIECDLIISTPTTAIFDSALMRKPLMIDATDDCISRVNAKNSLQNYQHLLEFSNLSQLPIANSKADIVRLISDFCEGHTDKFVMQDFELEQFLPKQDFVTNFDDFLSSKSDIIKSKLVT